MNNEIYFLKKQSVYFPKGEQDSADPMLLLTVLKNIESLGYTFSKPLIKRLLTLNEDELVISQIHLIDVIKKAVGSHVKYRPMYPNFPQQVIDASNAELFVNAMFHYLGDAFGVRILPKYRKAKRPELENEPKLKAIKLGTKKEFLSIFTNLLSSKIPVSETDKADIENFIAGYKNKIEKYIPEVIGLKENVGLLASLLKKHGLDYETFLKTHIKTATDMLRYIVGENDGDVSLKDKTQFKSITRKNRRLYIAILNNCGNIAEDMMRYREQWKRIGERLHPSEYQPANCTATNVTKAFNIVRNKTDFKSFNSKVEDAIQTKQVKGIVDLLKTRPGDFARKLDRVIRTVVRKQAVIDAFEEVATKVSSNVLLQLVTHFENRNDNDLRVVFPKGSVSKVYSIENDLPKIDDKYIYQIVGVCKDALISKYEQKEYMGAVYIDEKLKDYTVPFRLNSASKQLKTISRGSKISLPKGNTLRNFIYWKDGNDRTDIDLSVTFADKYFSHKDHVSYTELRNKYSVHSGDITSAPKGASEFIDIDIDKALGYGVRYVVVQVYAYTQQSYCDLPECFCGFMMREGSGKSGEIYSPKTVINKWDLASDSKTCIPVIFDLVERKMIWTDISMGSTSALMNLESHCETTQLMLRSMVNLKKPNLYDLFTLNAEARGTIVKTKGEADIVFSETSDIKPTDIDVIISDYI